MRIVSGVLGGNELKDGLNNMFGFLGSLFGGIGSFFGGLFKYKSALVTKETVEKAIPVVIPAINVVGKAVETVGTVSTAVASSATAAASLATAEAEMIKAEAPQASDSRYWLVNNTRPVISLIFVGVLIAHITGYLPFEASQAQIDNFYLISGGYLGVHSTSRGIFQIISALTNRK